MPAIQHKRVLLCLVLTVLCIPYGVERLYANEIDFEADIAPMLTKYCAGCHNDREPEQGFSVDSYAKLMQGSKDGAVIDKSDLAKSKLLGLIDGSIEPKMPPDEEPQLIDVEKKLLREWVLSGAKSIDRRPKTLAERVHALQDLKIDQNALLESYSLVFNNGQSIAYGMESMIRIDSVGGENLHTIKGIVGRVTSIREAANGLLIVASGVPGIGGQITCIEPSTGTTKLQFEAHTDVIYAATLNSSGDILATGGYDKDILLWDAKTGQNIGKLSGHNGAVYDLDFDPKGKLLCSASADETVKLWNVATRERLDTFSQCEAEQYTCRFDPSGERVFAAGADRRIRVWKVIDRDKPEVNPMIMSVFAHENAVVQVRFNEDGSQLVSAGNDQQVKRWSASDMRPMGVIGSLEGLPISLNWLEQLNQLVISTNQGKSIRMALPKVETSSTTPTANMEKSVDLVKLDVSTKSFSDSPGNDAPESAQPIELPALVQGAISRDTEQTDAPDNDYYSFEAQAGVPWVFTVIARQDKSPLDSRIEVLAADGSPILRTRLQAVRETYFTFRGKNSTQADDYRLHRWEDMELNELIYANGEVNKLWLYPRGPDSGFLVYPGSGNRWTYFDTTASTHALNEPAYIVRELAKDEAPIPNGLPVFPVYYENDDDADRRFDKDSQLYFTAPVTGRYLIRVRDARNLEGDNFKYKLEGRSPKPDYSVSASNKKPLYIGSGTELEVQVDRFDQFMGRVELKLEGLPDGFTYSEPLYIEREQIKAVATIYAPRQSDMSYPESIQVQVIAKAEINGEIVSKSIASPVDVKIIQKDMVIPRLVPSGGDQNSESLQELVIRPGETITANVVLEGGENKVEYSFGTEDSNRNFPHGIIISNIGLSGLLIPAGQDNRKFFITAAPWVEPQVRPIHLRNKNGENETTQPILLRVIPR